MKKRIISIITAAIMVFTFFGSATAYAASPESRTISIFDITKTVKMTKGTAKEFDAKKDMKLFAGYTVSTAAASAARLKLDDGSLIGIDEKSKISVDKASSKKLSISVLSGAISVNANTQTGGNSVEIRAGDTALAIRGTKFVFENKFAGGIVITMLSGGGDVNGIPLPAGRVMTITDTATGGTMTYDITDLNKAEGLSSFVLQVMLDNSEELLRLGLLTQDEVDSLQGMIDKAKREEALKDKANDTLMNQENRDVPPILDSGTASNSSDSGNEPHYAAKILINNEVLHKNYTTVAEAITEANTLAPTSIYPVYVVLIESCVLTQSSTIESNVTLKIPSGKTLSVNTTLTLDGAAAEIENLGSLTLGSAGILDIQSGTYYGDAPLGTLGAKIIFGDTGTSGSITLPSTMDFLARFLFSTNYSPVDPQELSNLTFLWTNSLAGGSTSGWEEE